MIRCLKWHFRQHQRQLVQMGNTFAGQINRNRRISSHRAWTEHRKRETRHSPIAEESETVALGLWLEISKNRIQIVNIRSLYSQILGLTQRSQTPRGLNSDRALHGDIGWTGISIDNYQKRFRQNWFSGDQGYVCTPLTPSPNFNYGMTFSCLSDFSGSVPPEYTDNPHPNW